MEQTPKPKRKTHTSNEVIYRYIKKTYKQISLKLRYDTPEENAIIQLIERIMEEKKCSANTAVKELIMKIMENH